MKKLIVFLIVLLIALIAIPPYKAVYSSVEPKTPPKPRTIQEMIQETAPRFNQSPALISKITWCESKHKVASHDGGRGKGVTGFHKATFDRYLKRYIKEGGEWLNYNSSYDQLKLMAYAFSKGESARREWSTYRAYKNGGIYSFYSKTLGKHFTVKCK